MTSALHYGIVTFSASRYNLPGSYKHQHSIRIPFDTVERSNWKHTTTAEGKILGSMTDHPAVGMVGADVLIAAFSLGLWAAFRATNVEDMLDSVIQCSKAAPFPSSTSTATSKEKATGETPATVWGSGRRTKSKWASTARSTTLAEEVAPEAVGSKRRGRPREAEIDAESSSGDSNFESTRSVAENAVDDEEISEEDDWESGALAWGLAVLGGWGTGSATVYGAECVPGR